MFYDFHFFVYGFDQFYIQRRITINKKFHLKQFNITGAHAPIIPNPSSTTQSQV